MYNKIGAFDDYKATRVLLLHGCWHTKEGTMTRFLMKPPWCSGYVIGLVNWGCKIDPRLLQPAG